MTKIVLGKRWGEAYAKIAYSAIWKLLSLVGPRPKVIETYREASPRASAQESVVYECTGTFYIEPESGYIISQSGRLIENAMTPNFDHYQSPLRIMVPSPFRFWSAMRRRHVVEVATVASLRHFWEWNYYHFYLDVLGKLSLLEKAGVNAQTPLAVAKYLDEAPFARQATKRGALSQRNWINPRDKYIKADKIIFCQTKTSYAERVATINRYMRDEADDANCANAPYCGVSERRIFLNRSNNRRLANLPEVQNFLERNGFEIVDTAGMSLDEQIALFASVRYLIAIHGAGTTNIIFRQPHPMSVLELHHERYMAYDHRKLCDDFGYYWDSLEGTMCVGPEFTKNPQHGDFTISPTALEISVKKLLAS